MNRKIDDLINKKTEKPDKKSIWLLFLVVLILILTIFGLIALSTFVGYYVSTFSGSAGYVYNLVLEYRECADLWAGVTGAAVMVPGALNEPSVTVSGCGISRNVNPLFDCLQPGMVHVVMFSQVPSSSINWNNLQAATPADVDYYLGVDAIYSTSAARTFLETMSYQIGANTYIVPGTRTKNNGTGNSSFDMGILKDGDVINGGGNLIFITHILQNFTRGYDNQLYNYQIILPLVNNTNPSYYIFTDPNYICPEGAGNSPEMGVIRGNVTNSAGSPLEGVIVDVAGVTTVTDIDGIYSMSVTAGTYHIFGIRSGYQAYVGNVTILALNTTVHNFVMVPEAVPNPNTGMGVGPGVTTKTNDNVDVGPGKDVGPGEAPRVPIVQEPKKIEGIDYIISISKIERKLMVGNFLQEMISFYSYKKGTANIQFTIEDDNSTANTTGTKLSDLIKLDKDK